MATMSRWAAGPCAALVVALGACQPAGAPDGRAAELGRAEAALTTGAVVATRDVASGGRAGGGAFEAPLQVGQVVYFAGNDGRHGSEPMRMTLPDGAPTLLRDINPGTNGSSPQRLVELGGVVYFAAYEEGLGTELWRTDGTVAGTTLVKDLQPGPASGLGAGPLVVFDGRLYFAANDGSTGMELWSSDGTSAGTQPVTAFSGTDSGLPSGGLSSDTPLVHAGRLFFKANDGSTGMELWSLDATGQTPHQVKDLFLGAPSGDPSWLTPVGSTLYFVATDANGRELWKSDGTEAGTVRVKDLEAGAGSSNPHNLTAFKGALYFGATTAVGGEAVYRSDGTSAGTTLLVDTDAANASCGSALFSSYPTICGYADQFTPVGDTLFFVAGTAATGRELWKTDGTTAALVKDIRPGAAGSGSYSSFWFFTFNYGPVGLRNVNGQLLFPADDGAHGSELWTSDGTAAGTVMVKELNPAGSGVPTFNVALLPTDAGVLFMGKDDTHPFGIWSTDGTAANTHAVRDVDPGRADLSMGRAVELGGKLYFAGNDPTGGVELWKSDGTSAGTVRVKDINSGTGSSYPADLVVYNGKVYFRADSSGAGDSELWMSDGTDAGTVRVMDINPGTGGSYPTGMTVFNNRLYFSANDGTNGNELWYLSAPGAAPALLKDLEAGSGSSTPQGFTVYNGALYFAAWATGSEWALYKSDGTALGTALLADTSTVAGDGDAQPTSLTATGNALYFLAGNSTTGRELWKTTGTGASLVRELAAGTASPGIQEMTAVGNRLFFTADDGNGSGRELWRSDGTSASTLQLRDILPGKDSSLASGLTRLGTTLYFRATDGESGVELWKSDGTTAGTVMVADVLPGPRSGLAGSSLFALDAEGALLFAGATSEQGQELWRSNGTEEGTEAFEDVVPGAESFAPAAFARTAGRVYFVGGTADQGRELWSVPIGLAQDFTPPTLSCPANATVEAVSAAGAPVSYGQAVAVDATGGATTLSYSRESGTGFPLGVTSVDVTAKDPSGNVARCTFTVTVRDSTPPQLTCPADTTLAATGASGAAVNFTAAVAHDAVTASPSLNYSHLPGTTFPVGTTQVTATATDAAGNEARCTFNVTVTQELKAEPGGCGCSGVGTGPFAWALLAVLGWLSTRRRPSVLEH